MYRRLKKIKVHVTLTELLSQNRKPRIVLAYSFLIKFFKDFFFPLPHIGNQVTWFFLITYFKSLNKYLPSRSYFWFLWTLLSSLNKHKALVSVNCKCLPRFFISLQLVAMGTCKAMTFRPTWKVREGFLKNWPQTKSWNISIGNSDEKWG